jgi:hypothetical protein
MKYPPVIHMTRPRLTFALLSVAPAFQPTSRRSRQQKGKSAHFTELGLQRHAALWADKLSAYLNIMIKEQ